MSTFTRTTATEWVCTDCHLSIAGHGPRMLDTGLLAPVPLDDVDGIEDVTNGTPIEDCDTLECRDAVAAYWMDNRDPVALDAARDLHTECDHDSFSLHPCAGCGSTLAGDRYAVTVSYIEWDDTH